MIRARLQRFAYVASMLAAAGAFVYIGQLVVMWTKGGWPPHDTSPYWVAGLHLRDGAPVYAGNVGGF